VKKIAITGGYGFIGSRLVRHFLAQGLEVVVLEHPKSIAPTGFPDIEVLPIDITNEEIHHQPQLGDIDALLHLAAQSSGPRSFAIPGDDIKLNILGTLNTINWCLRHDIDRMLFASSFVIYGDHPDREALSEDTCCLPKSVYAGSKLAAEHLLANYAAPKGIHWNALRMFNVYGPGQDITKPDQGVVGIFMNMLMKSDTVQVKGRLDRFRDLVYIEDVIAAWDCCLQKGARNKAYNLGSGKKTTFEQLIRGIAHTLDQEDRLIIEELPGTPGDMQGCYADMCSSKADLGFEPQIELSEGVLRMYEWVVQQRQGVV
jgi:UDP-glucose 4-epimerase